jgi:carbonic anhydrase
VVNATRGETDLDGQAFIERCSAENARKTAAAITAESEALRNLANKGDIKIATAMYALADDRVNFLND